MMPAVTPATVPVMPTVPSIPPTGVPVMPAISPATVPMVPVMPAPTTEVMRVVVTVAVARLMPAMAPSVADVSSLLNVRCLRGLTRNGDRHRRRRCGRECDSAECGEADKCRNKFHDIHLLTPVGGERATKGSVHYEGLTPMNNTPSAFRSLIGLFRTVHSPESTNLCRDGGSDENDVMVALSQPVLVLQASAL